MSRSFTMNSTMTAFHKTSFQRSFAENYCTKYKRKTVKHFNGTDVTIIQIKQRAVNKTGLYINKLYSGFRIWREIIKFPALPLMSVNRFYTKPSFTSKSIVNTILFDGFPFEIKITFWFERWNANRGVL